MLRSIAKLLVSTTRARDERRTGVASSPIADAMRTSRPSATDHAASIDRSRSRRASIFCFGITAASFGCHTWTSGSSSALVLLAATRLLSPAARPPAFSRHGPTPTNSSVPSSDQRGARKRTTRRSAASEARAGSSSRTVAGAAATSGHASATCVGPSRASLADDLSTASDGESLRQASPA